MLQISVHHHNGRHLHTCVLTDLPATIGRDPGCTVKLPGWGLHRRFCQLDLRDGQLTLKPLGDTVCFINDEQIDGEQPFQETDTIRIASYRLAIHRRPTVANEAVTGQAPGAPGEDVAQPQIHAHTQAQAQAQASKLCADEQGYPRADIGDALQPAVAPTETPASTVTSRVSESAAQLAVERSWRTRIQTALLHYIDLRRIHLDELEEADLRRRMAGWITDIIADMTEFPGHLDQATLIRQITDEAIGLGPLEDLLRDDSISEIMVNAHDEIFFEQAGRLLKSEVCFSNPSAVLSAIERIVSPLGRRIDESSPMVDARLKDGSRVNAVIPPLALKGPCITIRKFSRTRLRGEDLVGFGSMNTAMLAFLQRIVAGKQNMVISGGTGSGKTTLLNVLSGYIPDNERIITVEDAAELQLTQPNLVALEARPANQEGRGIVSIRDLVRNCLRMRPDRIVVGECRGGEALDMLQAMNTGHDGSLTTAHANSPRDCLSRMEVMVLMAGMDLPVAAIREQIASAVHFIAQQTRFPCGSRKVTSICEVNGLENGIVQLSEIFRFQPSGFDHGGRVTGTFLASGLIPDFCEQMVRQGYAQDLSIFQRQEPRG